MLQLDVCVCLTVVGRNSADVCKGQEHIQNSHTLGELVEATNHLSYLIQQLSNDTDVWGWGVGWRRGSKSARQECAQEVVE